METAVAAAVSGGGLGYADSVDSSPRSRGGDSWDEPPFPSAAAGRLRLMCSYGGRIVPRPTDKTLCYLGGETRIVVVDRHSSLSDLSAKLSRTHLRGRPFSLKYQLPNEDLDSLISVATDEDLENMIDEYDRILTAASTGTSGGSNRSSRLRLFLFPSKPESSPTSSIGSLLDDSKSETWFVDALNSTMGGMGIDDLPRGLSSDSTSVNCLLGLEDDSSIHSRGVAAVAAAPGIGGEGTHSELPEQLVLPRPDSSGKLARHVQDVHSVPDSPMLDTTSSFGSASSVPSLSNLPPIRVRPDDRPSDPRIAGLDDHFAHMNLSSGGGQRLGDDFKEPSYAPQLQPPPPIPFSASSASNLTISPTENPSRAFSSDDDKSDQGGIRKPQQPPKPTGIEAPNSDLGSRYYLSYSTAYVSGTEPKRELPVSSDPSYRIPIPVIDAAGYQLPSIQPEQFHEQQLHPQLHRHQQHQYIPANPHYIHHPATGGVIPVPSYFPVAAHAIQQPPQAHPYDPQMPVYYYPVRQPPSYNLAAVQPGMGDPNLISSGGKPAMPANSELPANLYRTAAPSPAATLQSQVIHVAADQARSFAAGMGYHVVPQQQQQQHISHSPATMSNYGYEFAADHTRPQMYYSKATPVPLSSGVVIADATATADAKATRAT
ncbi:unnamed protein product [Musa acuminata subsp. malaccensis]|uniref:(wild Malaysian banana) hypothetical protein n=1 Tax=Musa acuminata subsp. malaccensis TaxID=214687 RepID=A0A8D6ZKS8_MUSAM|nr:unnamed protein product [Musa acuminata subsp. malaccensis]